MKIYNSDESLFLELMIDDSSYRYRAINGDDSVTLNFSSAVHIELPVGCYIEYQGRRYFLTCPEKIKMEHSRHFEYTALFESEQAKAGQWKFINPVDKQIKFSYTSTPREHLQLFVDNMNLRDGGWSVGSCIDEDEKTIDYNNHYCRDALRMIAEAFNTEFEFDGKTVSLGKVEYNRSNPLPLSYGKGNGFKSGVTRMGEDNAQIVEILYVQGGERNIDFSKYGNGTLLLPKGKSIRYDGAKFEDENGFDESLSRRYKSDDKGYYIFRDDKPFSTRAEDSLDCTNVYPMRVGTVTDVEVKDMQNNLYDFFDDTVPDDLDYKQYIIAGERMTVVFQSGILSGKEFGVRYVHQERRFEIVPEEFDGLKMPNDDFHPEVGDKYAVFHCALPTAYVQDDATKSGASWEMMRKAVRYFYEREQPHFVFSGELDGLWAKRDWENIGGRIRLGGYVSFSDERFQQTPILIRITGIKDYVNDPHSPIIELSNTPVGGGLSSTLARLEAQEVRLNTLRKSLHRVARRGYGDAVETMTAIMDGKLKDFQPEAINPIAIKTMQLLVGSPSLQFRFVDGTTHPRTVMPLINYDKEAKTLSVERSTLQHMTLDITDIGRHEDDEYHFWLLPSYRSAVLDDDNALYYLYARVSRTTKDGVFLLSNTSYDFEGDDYYYLLVGILNASREGDRSFVSLYGFTEVLPGQITTGRINSADGSTYFDLDDNTIAGNIRFIGSDGQLHDIADLSEEDYIKKAIHDGTTTIAGGLILTNIMALKDSDGNVRAYLDGDPSHTTAFKAGVSNAFTHSETSGVLITHDGNAKFGDVYIDANGRVRFQQQGSTTPYLSINGDIPTLNDLKSHDGAFREAFRYRYHWITEPNHGTTTIRQENDIAFFYAEGTTLSLDLDYYYHAVFDGSDTENKPGFDLYLIDTADNHTIANLGHATAQEGTHQAHIIGSYHELTPGRKYALRVRCQTPPRWQLAFYCKAFGEPLINADEQSVCIGTQGLYAFYSSDRMLYASRHGSTFFTLRGKVDMPGVLFALQVDITGGGIYSSYNADDVRVSPAEQRTRNAYDIVIRSPRIGEGTFFSLSSLWEGHQFYVAGRDEGMVTIRGVNERGANFFGGGASFHLIAVGNN